MRGPRGCGRIARRRDLCFVRGSRSNGLGQAAGRDMSAWQFILASLRHYRRIHLAVAMGVAVATAVLTGALLVGDSVRGSLRDLTLQRLGLIDDALIAPRFFNADLAQRIARTPEFTRNFTAIHPAILTRGAAGRSDESARTAG